MDVKNLRSILIYSTSRESFDPRSVMLVPLLAASIAIGCQETTGPKSPDFGAHYNVPLQPDAPTLAVSSFSVTVSYAGCGYERDFLLHHRLRSDGVAEIWLRKVTFNEPCDMLVNERRTFSAPSAVGSSATVILLTPNNDPYQVRP
jgi:hypothetical protein